MRVRIGSTWSCLLLLLVLICALAAPAAVAEPAPGSLRVVKTPTGIRVTWQAGLGPYGVYRSPDADDIVRPAWLVGGSVADLFWDEPAAAAPPGSIFFYNVTAPLPCTSVADCDDHRPCDGTEFCDARTRRCAEGAPLVCNDGDPCTEDACDEQTVGCVFTPLQCEDGNPCTIDECRPDSGCYAIVDPAAGVGLPAQVAGRSLTAFPLFDFVDVFNQGSSVEVAVDPFAHPDVAGQTCDVYVLAGRSAAQWCTDRSLADVRGAPDTLSFAASGTAPNRFPLAGGTGLSANAGTGVGRPYDVVLDCNRNGLLDSNELADGLEDGPGFSVVHDLTQAGPLAVSQFDDIGPQSPHCSGGGNDDMRIYYPSQLEEPGFSGRYPLVVISHGNGHCYDWYDFLGTHLASYGYIVMSHDNNTGPGIETASTTTLQFTDKILANQATLGGGVLAGHIDATRIAWIGHSRGGEGVARAFDRIVDEGYTPQQYRAADIRVISSIAPTDFLGPARADPHATPYHLLYGSADGDVCGCPDNSVAQSFGLYERATGVRQSTYVHGADHNDFNCCGFDDFDGPPGTATGRPEAQQVQKAVTLALVKHYLEGSRAAKDYLWRQWETLRPLGVGANTVVVNELREAPAQRSFVLDDYQAQPSPNVSSSGGSVSFTVAAVAEDRERETNGQFAWTGSEPMNGMTRGRDVDVGRGAVFEFAAGGEAFYEFAVVPAQRDFSDDGVLSFRATQMTRHPLTTAAIGDLTFTVTLRDGSGQTSSIGIGVFGGGIEEPYPRDGYGAGEGWQNEFETIRIRLMDFRRDGSALNLADIVAVRFDFGGSFGSAEGRIGIDDVELVEE